MSELVARALLTLPPELLKPRPGDYAHDHDPHDLVVWAVATDEDGELAGVVVHCVRCQSVHHLPERMTVVGQVSLL